MYRLLVASMAYSTAASSFTCVVNDPSPCGNSGGLFILVSPSVVVVSVGESLTPRASWCHDGRYDNVPAQWSLGQAADAEHHHARRDDRPDHRPAYGAGESHRHV